MFLYPTTTEGIRCATCPNETSDRLWPDMYSYTGKWIRGEGSSGWITCYPFKGSPPLLGLSSDFWHYILKAPDEYPVFTDLLYGDIRYGSNIPAHNTGSYSDPIMLKSDGMPTYHLANVVDDHFMKITHVIRATVNTLLAGSGFHLNALPTLTILYVGMDALYPKTCVHIPGIWLESTCICPRRSPSKWAPEETEQAGRRHWSLRI